MIQSRGMWWWGTSGDRREHWEVNMDKVHDILERTVIMKSMVKWSYINKNSVSAYQCLCQQSQGLPKNCPVFVRNISFSLKQD